MTEQKWVRDIILEKLKFKFDKQQYRIKQGEKLIYAYEIEEYSEKEEPKLKSKKYEKLMIPIKK